MSYDIIRTNKVKTNWVFSVTHEEWLGCESLSGTYVELPPNVDTITYWIEALKEYKSYLIKEVGL